MGDFPKAVTAADFVVAMLAEFLVEPFFGNHELVWVEFLDNVPECSLFKVEDCCWVEVNAFVAHFEMQMGAKRTAGVAADADGVACLQCIADFYFPTGKMGI